MTKVDGLSRSSVAVVGAGYWGKNLIRNFHRIGVLAAICDGAWLLLSGISPKNG